MATDSQTATVTAQTPDAASVATSPLPIPDFAAKIRKRDARLTPDLVDDATLVRKVLERKPELMQYVETSIPRKPMNRGRVRIGEGKSPEEIKAADDIEAILKGRDTKDLSYPERFQVASILGKEFARQHAEKGRSSKDWMDKAKNYLMTFAGVDMDVSNRILSGASEPKNIGIGATGFVSPSIPAAYFLWDGASRLPGEARKAAADPTYENLINAGLTATQVLGGATGMDTKSKAPAEERGGTGAKASVVQSILQRMAGTGDKLAKTLATEEKETREGVAQSSGIKREDLALQIKRINEDYDGRIADAKQKYATDVAAREKAVAEAEADHVEKVANLREKWIKDTQTVRHENKGAALVEAHRQKLQGAVNGLTNVVKENVKNVHDITKKALNERWDQLRDAVGKDTPVEVVHKDSGIPEGGSTDITEKIAKRPPSVVEAINESRAMLAGVPDDLKIFNDLMKQITEKDGVKGDDNAPMLKESIPFDNARTQYSAIGDKAFGSEGNMRRALFNVYDAYDRALNKTAESKGQGKTYSQLKGDWGQFRKDWDDMSSQATGGSPLARLYRAEDPGVALSTMAQKNFSDRLIATFARYTKYGADPRNLAKVRNYNFELNSLPKELRVKPEPGKLQLPEKPETKAVEKPDAKISDINADRNTKIQRAKEDEQVAVDRLAKARSPEEILTALKDLKREKVEAKVEKQATLTDHDQIMIAVTTSLGIEAIMGNVNLVKYAPIYLVYRLGEAVAFRNPKFQEVLGRITDKDIAELSKLYENDPAAKAEAQRVFTGGLEARAKQGLPAPPISRFAKFLNPDQIQKVMKAYVPIGQHKEDEKNTRSSVQ